jgi:hypothetical protein
LGWNDRIFIFGYVLFIPKRWNLGFYVVLDRELADIVLFDRYPYFATVFRKGVNMLMEKRHKGLAR